MQGALLTSAQRRGKRRVAELPRLVFREYTDSARKALSQNPRAAQAARMLAVCLAHPGDADGAAKALEQALAIEPELTLAKLRLRLKFMPEALWARMAQGLRVAGLS